MERPRPAQRVQIVDHVVWERVDAPVHYVDGERDAECERVPVGLRAGDPAGTEVPVRAGHVFDDERLAERAAQTLGDDTRITSDGPPAPDGTTIEIGRDG